MKFMYFPLVAYAFGAKDQLPNPSQNYLSFF